jgi:hypothetical protein
MINPYFAFGLAECTFPSLFLFFCSLRACAAWFAISALQTVIRPESPLEFPFGLENFSAQPRKIQA